MKMSAIAACSLDSFDPTHLVLLRQRAQVGANDWTKVAEEVECTGGDILVDSRAK